jgi:protein phosphatase
MPDTIPSGLLLLVGADGSGKTNLARRLIASGQISSSAVVSTDALGAALRSTDPARIRSERTRRLTERLRIGKTTVLDDPNLDRSARDAIGIAERFGLPVSVVRLDPGVDVCRTRLAQSGRHLGGIVEQHRRLESLTPSVLRAAGVNVVVEAGAATPDLRVMPDGMVADHLIGGFDVIGDVHGHRGPLLELLAELGYDDDGNHPDGRIPVLVGDIVDKGPDPLGTLRLVMDRHRQGKMLAVKGNHEAKLARTLSTALTAAAGSTGRFVCELGRVSAKSKPTHAVTLEAIRTEDGSCALSNEIVRFVGRLPLHLVLDSGKLVVTHAAIRSDQVGRPPADTEQRRDLERWCLYGPPPPPGTPRHVRNTEWTTHYDGAATVVHGHTVVRTPEVHNKVVSIDTGAGDNRALSALSWPAMTTTSVACS